MKMMSEEICCTLKIFFISGCPQKTMEGNETFCITGSQSVIHSSTHSSTLHLLTLFSKHLNHNPIPK